MIDNEAEGNKIFTVLIKVGTISMMATVVLLQNIFKMQKKIDYYVSNFGTFFNEKERESILTGPVNLKSI